MANPTHTLPVTANPTTAPLMTFRAIRVIPVVRTRTSSLAAAA